MEALVIGATGSTGVFLVDKLLMDVDYTIVKIFVRRSTGKQHAKLLEYIVDFSDINAFKDLIVGDVVFSCFETSLKEACSRENQRKINLNVPIEFAMYARRNEINSFVLVTSFGASSDSRALYSKKEKELEENIARFYFEQYIIFRSGLLVKKGSGHFLEKVIVLMVSLFNSIGMFEEFKPLPIAILAEKMVKAPKVLPSGTSVVKNKRVFTL